MEVIKSLREHFRWLLLLMCFFICLSLSAVNDADSLLKVASNSSGKTKFDALKALSKFYKSADPQKSVNYAVAERNQARLMNDRSLEADALNDMAIPMLMMAQNRQGILLLQESIHIYDSLKNDVGKARATTNLGIAWGQIGSFEKSLNCYNKALTWYLKTNDQISQARIYMNTGLVYEQLGKFDQELNAQRKALEIFTSAKNEKMMADVGVNIAVALKSTGNFTEAEQYLKKSFEYYQREGVVYGMAVATNNLAQVYKSKGDYRQAFECYKKALPLIRQVNNTWAEAAVFLDLAEIQFEKANWNEALSNLTTADKLNVPENDPGMQSHIFLLYSRIYDTIQQTRLAFKFFKRYTALKDTLSSAEKTKVIEELNIRFETEKKNDENKLLMSDIRVHKLRQYMLLAFSLAGLLTTIILVNYFLRKRKLLLRKKIQAEAEREEAREAIGRMSQELTAKALQMAGNADKKAAFAEKLALLIPHIDTEGRPHLQNLVEEFNSATDENLWDEFHNYFGKMHPAFMTTLAKQFPELTGNDRKICAMVRLNLSTKEIALILNRSVRTIESARYQVKKKLLLSEDQNLTSFLMAL